MEQSGSLLQYPQHVLAVLFEFPTELFRVAHISSCTLEAYIIASDFSVKLGTINCSSIIIADVKISFVVMVT